MRILLSLGLVFFLFVFSILSETPFSHFNLDKQGLALSGYDPVSYHLGKPTPGDPRFTFTYHGAVYWFDTEVNKSKFIKKPDKYTPEYGGWCAYAFGLGKDKVEVDPKTYKIVNGKLHLFYKDFFTDTKKLWNENESELKKNADKNWQEIINP